MGTLVLTPRAAQTIVVGRRGPASLQHLLQPPSQPGQSRLRVGLLGKESWRSANNELHSLERLQRHPADNGRRKTRLEARFAESRPEVCPAPAPPQAPAPCKPPTGPPLRPRSGQGLGGLGASPPHLNVPWPRPHLPAPAQVTLGPGALRPAPSSHWQRPPFVSRASRCHRPAGPPVARPRPRPAPPRPRPRPAPPGARLQSRSHMLRPRGAQGSGGGADPERHDPAPGAGRVHGPAAGARRPCGRAAGTSRSVRPTPGAATQGEAPAFRRPRGPTAARHGERRPAAGHAAAPRAERPARRRGCCRRAARRPPRGAPGLARSRGRRRRRATMSAAKENPCRKFQANIFNKSKCQNCFKPRESHLLNDKDLTQAS
nr:basic proline-rich protein-like [Equus asinus]